MTFIFKKIIQLQIQCLDIMIKQQKLSHLHEKRTWYITK